MTELASLPQHQSLFHYNMVIGLAGDGFSTTINIFNYFNGMMFGDGYESPATADLVFYDQHGKEGFKIQRRLEPWSSAYIDLGEELRRDKAVGAAGVVMGTIYSRLIPDTVPAMLKGKRVSTELTAEIETPSGARDFIHNTGAPAYVPIVSQYKGGILFADQFTDPCHMVLVNRYLGPKIPFISEGFAKIEIKNHLGDSRTATTERVPARGMRLFSILDHFPDIYDFLDGQCGVMNVKAANLMHKPWIWFGARDGKSDISIDHT